MFFGGVVGGGTFEFDSPEAATESPTNSPRADRAASALSTAMGGGSLFTPRRRPGRKAKFSEESDDRVRTHIHVLKHPLEMSKFPVFYVS